MKTIRQIADELGVSKQAVAKRIKREPLATELQPHLATTANGIHISDEGVTLILSDYSTNRQPTPTANRQPTTDNHVVDFLMEQLKEKDKQLAAKDGQIAEKDKQIENLSTVLLAAQQTAAAAQALHAGTIKQLDSGELMPNDRTTPVETDVTNKKNGFIARIFKKEKTG